MEAPAKRLELTAEEAATLRLWAASGTTQQRMVVRARVILFAADGCPCRKFPSVPG